MTRYTSYALHHRILAVLFLRGDLYTQISCLVWQPFSCVPLIKGSFGRIPKLYFICTVHICIWRDLPTFVASHESGTCNVADQVSDSEWVVCLDGRFELCCEQLHYLSVKVACISVSVQCLLRIAYLHLWSATILWFLTKNTFIGYLIYIHNSSCEKTNGFRNGRGGVDQRAIVRLLRNMKSITENYVCTGFMDLEKPYDRFTGRGCRCWRCRVWNVSY